LEYTRKRAAEASQRAIEAIAKLPESRYKEALTELAVFSVSRNH